jgi:hypothetical protein
MTNEQIIEKLLALRNAIDGVLREIGDVPKVPRPRRKKHQSGLDLTVKTWRKPEELKRKKIA